jgi:hypothetical protein
VGTAARLLARLGEDQRAGGLQVRDDQAGPLSRGHIHIIIKEPGRREYWIDDAVFTDDPLVNDRYRAGLRNQGGNGIVTPKRDAKGAWQVRRDIILEQ